MHNQIKLAALISICLLALTGFHYKSYTEKNSAISVTGAYRMTAKQGDAILTAVKIVTGSYFTIAYYDLAGKKFAGTEGGTYSFDGDNLVETIEFNSMDSTKVGSVITLQSSMKGNKWQLAGSKYGKKIKDSWERIPEENAQHSPLKGAWRITQKLDASSGNMSPMTQGARKTIKMMSGTRFQWIAYNTATKQFSGTGGGTYTAKDGKYTETIEFFSRDPSRVGAQLTFDFKVQDRDWHHSGKSSTGNTIGEIWSNVDNLNN